MTKCLGSIDAMYGRNKSKSDCIKTFDSEDEGEFGLVIDLSKIPANIKKLRVACSVG